MRHYEIVFLIHPDRSEQVSTMIESYKTLIAEANGKVHREEDWGLRKLEYPIKKVHKAHYVLMNIEIDLETFKKLKKSLDFNDDILRYLDIRCERAITEPSPQRRPAKEHYHSNNSNNASDNRTRNNYVRHSQPQENQEKADSPVENMHPQATEEV